MEFQENGLIDEDLWKSQEWEMFYCNNLNILDDIRQIFIDNAFPFNKDICLTTDFIADILDKNPKFIHLYLAIWQRHYCSFYKKYGRIGYNTETNTWVYNLRQT